MDKDKGLISQYTFSVSDDGRNWREVKKGQFSYHYIRKDPAVQRIDFGSLWRPATSSLTPGLR